VVDMSRMPNGALPGALTNGVGYNYPLRAGKTTLFEGGVRGVGFITGGKLPENLKGTKNNALLHGIDIVAGQLAAVGLSNKKLDGIDLFETVFNNQKGHDVVYLDVHRSGDIPNFASALIKGSWKYIELDGVLNIYDGWWVNVTGPPVPAADDCSNGCLFNLDTDPSEQHNLIQENFQKALELQILLNQARLNRNGFYDQQSFIPDSKCIVKTIKQAAWVPIDY